MRLLICSIWVLVRREWKRYFRQRSRVFSSLMTPLLFWGLMGMGFGSSFKNGMTTGYLEYFYPGILMMTLLFASIFSMISLIEDRNEGFLQSVMVSPASHLTIVFGKILGAASLSVAQSLLLLPFAPLAGIPMNPSIASQLLLVFFITSIFMCSLSFLFAWVLNSSQGYHAVMNIVLFPMWILSGAMFPMQGSAQWIQWIMRLNPLTYAVDAVRRIIYTDMHFFTMLSELEIRFDLSIMLVFCTLFIFLSLNSLRKSYR